ncbi:MAG: Ig-like domain-containing protein [Longimicrobiales bacterium]|nr:Ig-like domain-containing protein [Longimicrobiales bacterium]
MKRLRPLALAATLFLAACPGDDGPTEPPAPVVASVTVAPGSATLAAAGATVQFLATAKDGAGGLVTNQPVTWASSNTAVATVSTSGLATAVAPGTAAVTATVSGVAGSAVVTVSQPSQACASPNNVTLSAGQAQSFNASDCLVLPSGASGDRYRVIVLRPTDIANAADVPTATLKVVGLGVSQAAPAAVSPRPAPQILPDLSGLSPAALRRALRISEATERFHATLRQREEALLRSLGARHPAPTRARPGLAAVAAQAPAPAKITLDVTSGSSCVTNADNKKTALLIHETDDLIFYQDSTQNATKPLTVSLATKMADYYSKYAKQMIVDYFGKPSDIDANGKVLVFVSPAVQGDVAAFVWSGNFFTTRDCAASNQRELIFFNMDLILDLEDTSPSYQALETLAHEMKHVVSLYNRIVASSRLGPQAPAQYHPTWIEEGTAEIAGEMSSRIAWAAIGGPAVNAEVTRQSFVSTQGGIVPENYGVAIKLARTAWYLSSQPNGLVVAPNGAQEGSSVYGSGWLFHRWLGDAFGNAASAPKRDAAFFRALNDSLAGQGTAGLTQQTGKSFPDLLDDFTRAVSLHKTTAPAPALDFKTYDLVASAEIFCTPNPLGVFPWPVTTTGTKGDCAATPRVTETSIPSASFKTADYTGSIGAGGMRIHDFLSNGSGTGAQIQLDITPPAKIWVVRLR